MFDNVTLEMIEQKVREVARKNPKRVYASGPRRCRYELTRNKVTHRKDRCIFGQAFSELGVVELDLKAISAYGVGTAITDLFGIEKNEQTEPSFRKFRQVQIAQDTGSSWGEAVKEMG